MAKRIVIADDSATIQRAFAMTFGAEDVTLVAARSAEEGLALTRQLQPELVIADGMMPGRSGYDLCAQIKADPVAVGDRGLRAGVGAATLRRVARAAVRGRRASAEAVRYGGDHREGAPGAGQGADRDRAAAGDRADRGRLRSADPVRRALRDPERVDHVARRGRRRRRVWRDQRRHVAADARGRRARGRGRICRGAGRARAAGVSSLTDASALRIDGRDACPGARFSLGRTVSGPGSSRTLSSVRAACLCRRRWRLAHAPVADSWRPPGRGCTRSTRAPRTARPTTPSSHSRGPAAARADRAHAHGVAGGEHSDPRHLASRCAADDPSHAAQRDAVAAVGA